MSPKELVAHIQLWEDVSKYLIDPEGKITEIFDRSRAKSPENPIGYLINGLKGEVEQAKKRTESKIQQPSLFDQPQVEVANFNDGESLMKSINSVESKTKNKHYKTTFTKEQLQETFSEVDMGMSIHDWALSLGYKYDETKEVYYK